MEMAWTCPSQPLDVHDHGLGIQLLDEKYMIVSGHLKSWKTNTYMDENTEKEGWGWVDICGRQTENTTEFPKGLLHHSALEEVMMMMILLDAMDGFESPATGILSANITQEDYRVHHSFKCYTHPLFSGTNLPSNGYSFNKQSFKVILTLILISNCTKEKGNQPKLTHKIVQVNKLHIWSSRISLMPLTVIRKHTGNSVISCWYTILVFLCLMYHMLSILWF